MKDSIKKELFRKIIHICSALVPFLLRISYWLIIVLLVLALLIYICGENLRLRGKRIPLLTDIVEFAARKRDENHFVYGPVTLVIGILISSLFFPLDCACAGIFALAFGDGFASIVGKAFGRKKLPVFSDKSYAGSGACFAGVFLSILVFCKNPVISLLMALMITLIEAASLDDFDNLIIPVFGSAFYLFLISFL